MITVQDLIDPLCRHRRGALVFICITDAKGKETVAPSESVGNHMFKVMYLEGTEESEEVTE